MQGWIRRLFVAGLALGVVALVGSSAVAFGAGSSSEGSSSAEGSGASSPLGGALVTSGSPAEGEQMQAQQQARLTSPEAVTARQASQTSFEGLSGEAAEKLAGEAFPKVVHEPAGGPPKLPAGQSIVGYPTDEAAQVDLPEGKHAVIESMAPIALETSGGGHVPVDLGLSETGGAFEPKTPVVGMRIPKSLGGGVQLPGVGVSLTPIDGSGVPLGGSEGAIDGASVLYTNTQTDMDSLVKPTTEGFEADTILRSVESPQQLFFRVGLPAGASLVAARDGSGDVEVVEEGATIAAVLPPGAQDAAGTAVPVSMSVSGDRLVLSVADHAAEYQYPVEVDPEVTGKDVQLTKEGSKRSNWEFYTGKGNGKKEPSTNFSSSEEGGILKTYGVHEYAEKEEAFWVYQTRGVSKIYEFEGETEASNKEDRIESIVELQYGEVKTESGITEAEGKAKEKLSTETEGTSEYKQKALPKVLCPSGEASCPSSAGHEGNAVHFQQSVVTKPTSKYSFSDELDKGTVYISEPEIENAKKEKEKIHSTTSENTSSTEFEVEVENSKKEKVKEKRKNALDGTNNWLSEYDGALQFTAEDKGIGVAKSWLEYENSGKWEVVSGSEHNYLEEGLCKGVQCESKQQEYWTLNPHLPNGEDKIRYRAEEAFGDATHETESLATEGVGTVKVETSKPYSIFIAGLPYGNELSEKSYKFTAYATDGEGSTIPSSGISSLAVFIENSKGEKKEITKTGGTGECLEPKGQCTASAEYTINGAEIGAGHHGIVITAKDRAGNEGREEETISIRHSTPVPVGPGDVDLESGDFTLGPTDVSLGGGLSVSRVYSSRDVTAGVEGGSLLGSQWSLSVGSEESLVELPDKSVMVTSGNGGQTIFAAMFNEKHEPTGKFEAPPGDSNLTMTLEENERKEKVAYYLKDLAAGTSTKFELPAGSIAKVWVPFEQTGPVATDTVSYVYETAEVGGKKVTRPKEERGATTAKEVSCSPEPKPGCRLLKFTYASKTKSEIGEGPTEWGEFEGRLVKVSYEGYNPATKKMTEAPIPVAEYVYDKLGRLRAEWDPRLAPHELRTEYGYDSEGHVAALNPPGQEPWVFTYGAIAGDAGTGRLMKVMRAPTTAGLWNGETLGAPTSEAKITGTLTANSRIGATNPVWHGTPLAYVYQWTECEPERKNCKVIPGATNQGYTLMAANIGHELSVRVTAMNGGGTGESGSTAWTSELIRPASEYALPKESEPTGLTLGPDGNMWFANRIGAKEAVIGKVTSTGTITTYPLATGTEAPAEVVSGPGSDLWVPAHGGTPHIDKVTTAGAVTEYPLPKESTALDLLTGPDGNLWFIEAGNAAGTSPRIAKITPAGTVTEYAVTSKYHPENLVVGPDKNLWFTEHEPTGNINKIAKITTSGTITQYAVGGQDPTSLASNGSALWFTAEGKVDTITTSGSVTTYGLPPKTGRKLDPGAIVTGPDGNLWFGIKETNESGTVIGGAIGKITTGGTISQYPLPATEADPKDLLSMTGGDIWFVEKGNTELGGGVVASISTSGSITEYPLLTIINLPREETEYRNHPAT